MPENRIIAMSVDKARVGFFMIFSLFVPTTSTGSSVRLAELNAILLGELVGTNENASFRILRTYHGVQLIPVRNSRARVTLMPIVLVSRRCRTENLCRVILISRGRK